MRHTLFFDLGHRASIVGNEKLLWWNLRWTTKAGHQFQSKSNLSKPWNPSKPWNCSSLLQKPFLQVLTDLICFAIDDLLWLNQRRPPISIQTKSVKALKSVKTLKLLKLVANMCASEGLLPRKVRSQLSQVKNRKWFCSPKILNSSSCRFTPAKLSLRSSLLQKHVETTPSSQCVPREGLLPWSTPPGFDGFDLLCNWWPSLVKPKKATNFNSNQICQSLEICQTLKLLKLVANMCASEGLLPRKVRSQLSQVKIANGFVHPRSWTALHADSPQPNSVFVQACCRNM